MMAKKITKRQWEDAKMVIYSINLVMAATKFNHIAIIMLPYVHVLRSSILHAIFPQHGHVGEIKPGWNPESNWIQNVRIWSVKYPNLSALTLRLGLPLQIHLSDQYETKC